MKASDFPARVARASQAARSKRREARLASALGSVFSDIGDEAARRFEQKVEQLGEGRWAMPLPDELVPLEQAERLIADTIAPHRTAALDAFAARMPATITKENVEHAPLIAAAAEDVAISWDVTNPYWGTVYEKTGAHITNIAQTTRRRVMKNVRRGYENGDSVPEVADTIRATIRGSSRGRATTIARTELNRIANGAALAATTLVSREAGIGYQKRWLTAPGAEHPRHEDYDGLDGQTVELSGMFDVGGNDFEYPGDPDGDPGDSINCRCAVEFVEGDVVVGEAGDLAAGGRMVPAAFNDYLVDKMGEMIAAAAGPPPAMVCLYPTEEQAAALAQPGGEAAEDLHVTLVFLGTPMQATLDTAAACIGRVAANQQALHGSVAGIGAFKDNGDGFPMLALPDVPGLPELRQAVTEELRRAGVWYSEEHGYTPHITLAYAMETLQTPPESILGQQLDFAAMYVVSGNADWSESPLLTAAALPFNETIEGDAVSATETTEEAADTSEPCANCDHAMSSHAGEDNMGACSVEDCSCGGYEEAAAETGEAGITIHAASGFQPAEGQVFKFFLNGEEFTSSSGTNIKFVAMEPPVEETLPAESPSAEVAAVPVRTNAAEVPWHAIFAPEGKATDDGRIFSPGSIGWRTLPLSLMAMTETSEGGHVGAQLAGRIDEIYRNEEPTPVLIEADGVFNDTEKGHEIADLVTGGSLTGNSVDLAVNSSLICLRADVVDEDGMWLEGLDPDTLEEVDILAVMLGEIPFEDVIFVITDAVIGMSTVCPFPAFADATIEVTAGGAEQHWASWPTYGGRGATIHVGYSIAVKHEDDHLTASAAGLAPLVPERDWFIDPEFDRLTPHTVTDEGMVFGHAWQWGECHVGMQDACTVAPHSNTDYAYYLLKEVETTDGKVEVGTITLDTNHAAKHLNWTGATAHYDNTGTAVADVAFGEDEFGGWYAGALRPDVSAEAVRKFRGASVSGDWRRIHGNLELVGLLSCNVPGFPVPRAEALVAAGEDSNNVLTLVAAGITDVPAEITEANLAELEVLRAQATGELDELAKLAEEAK